MDGVVEDLRKLRIKSWWRVARDKSHGRKFCGKPRLTSGCSANDDDDDPIVPTWVQVSGQT
jgi:hypothetical protein